METMTDFIFLGSRITADGDCSHEIKRPLLFGRKAMTNLHSILKSKDITSKCPSSQSYDFSSSHVWVWELDHKESWALKNWCFWTVVLEETLESPLDFKMIKPVSPKENQSWILIGRTDAEAEVQDFGHLMWRIGKTLMLGKIEGRRRRGRQDEMVGWNHQFNGHEFEQAQGVGDGQGTLMCFSPWGRKEMDTTEWLNCMN